VFPVKKVLPLRRDPGKSRILIEKDGEVGVATTKGSPASGTNGPYSILWKSVNENFFCIVAFCKAYRKNLEQCMHISCRISIHCDPNGVVRDRLPEIG